MRAQLRQPPCTCCNKHLTALVHVIPPGVEGSSHPATYHSLHHPQHHGSLFPQKSDVLYPTDSVHGRMSLHLIPCFFWNVHSPEIRLYMQCRCTRRITSLAKWSNGATAKIRNLSSIECPPSPYCMLAIRRFGYKSLDETGSPVQCFGCCSLKHSHHDPPSDVLQLPLLRCMLAPGIPRPCCGPAAYATGS